MEGIVNNIHVFLLILTISTLFIFSGEVEAILETVEWNTDFIPGILRQEASEFGIEHKVSFYDFDSLKIEWNKPNLPGNVVGYEILRKTLDTDYVTIVKNSHSVETTFVDKDLADGYYGYKIIPIIEKLKPQQVSKHGIDRNHSMFKVYQNGQELLAKEKLKEILGDKIVQNESLDEPKTHYGKFMKRSEDPALQNSIKQEILKAEQIFNKLFKFRHYY